MRPFRLALLAFALLAAVAARPVGAGETGSLFVNLTTDEPHRAAMALTFSKAQMSLGHPVTVWLNDRGVFVGDVQSGGKFSELQGMLKELMAGGAQVIACPMCMKHYGIGDTSMLQGIKTGSPQMTGAALFKDDTRTLTW
ncbi:MAG: DsrE family protein [Rhodospirillales bacterium]|jgi:peroxiredoxin family protein|nr:DsrE family protein [Rhodospirillales bacterium]